MTSYVSSVCSSCKWSSKRDCDGQVPACSNCLKQNRTCVYTIADDRRHRKYHADYIFFLQNKVNKLEEFIAKHDPGAAGKLEAMTEAENPEIGVMLEALTDLHIDEFIGPYEEQARPDIFYLDDTFIQQLLNLYRHNMFDFPYIINLSLPEVETWDFATDTSPSHQLLMCAMFGLACMYCNYNDIGAQFISQASQIAVKACKTSVDKYLVQGLLLLSCYEMGMGRDSMSYLYISMACSLTQHMGYHITYDENSSAAGFAPRSTPYQSALLWSICLQDRVITTKSGVPSCIHFKRIISPFYEIQSSPLAEESNLLELSFAYTSRLWYILDRFTDQISSVQGDLGDSQERSKLFKAAESLLDELKRSLPPAFREYTNNYHSIIFRLNYEACVILLERLFVREVPARASSRCVSSAIEISRIIDVLLESGEIFKMSYQFGFICYLAGMVHLVLKNQEHLHTCITALKINGETWKSSVHYLTLLGGSFEL